MTRLLLRALVAMLVLMFFGWVLSTETLSPAYTRAETAELCHAFVQNPVRPVGETPNVLRRAQVEVLRRCDDRTAVLWHRGRYVVARIVPRGFIPLVGIRLPWVPQGTARWWLVLGVGVAVLAALWIVWPITRRLRQVEGAVRDLANGDLTARAPVDGKDAIGSLARGVNALADRTDRALRNGDMLLGLVAHELRTPIARARFAASLAAADRSADDRLRHEAQLEEALDDLADVVQAVEQRMAVSQRLAGGSRTPTDLHAVVREALAGVDAEHGIVPVAPAPEAAPVVVDGDAVLLGHLVRNLVDNACRHARGRVEVVVTGTPAPTLIVRDDGPGIAPADRERLLAPFTSGTSPGTLGLGLSLVHTIAENHDATLTLEDGPDGGLDAVVRFPSLVHTA